MLHNVLISKDLDNDGVYFLRTIAQKILTATQVRKFLIARNADGDTAFYLAANPFSRHFSKNLNCY